MAPHGVGYANGLPTSVSTTTGHWGSGNTAFALSFRRCGTPAYPSSAVPRFPSMLLSPRPFGSRLGGHLGVICPELRPPPGAILSVRTMAHPLSSSGSYGPAAGRIPICQSTNNFGSRRAMRPNQCSARRRWRLSRLYLRLAQYTKERSRLLSTGVRADR